MKQIKLYPLLQRDAARQQTQKILDDVTGKLSHTVSVADIFSAIQCTETELEILHCPLKDAVGVKIVIDGSEEKKRSYKYSYEVVQVTIIRDPKGWCIDNIARITAWPGRANQRKVFYPKDLIPKIAENISKNLLSY